MAGPMRRPQTPNSPNHDEDLLPPDDSASGGSREDHPNDRGLSRGKKHLASDPVPGESRGLDPDVFGFGQGAEPAIGLSELGASPRETPGLSQNTPIEQTSLQDTRSKRPSPPRVSGSDSPQKVETPKKRGGFAFVFMVFVFVGLLAFGAGASLAYYVLNGDLDMSSAAVKEALASLKTIFKSWRLSP